VREATAGQEKLGALIREKYADAEGDAKVRYMTWQILEDKVVHISMSDDTGPYGRRKTFAFVQPFELVGGAAQLGEEMSQLQEKSAASMELAVIIERGASMTW